MSQIKGGRVFYFIRKDISPKLPIRPVGARGENRYPSSQTKGLKGFKCAATALNGLYLYPWADKTRRMGTVISKLKSSIL